MVPPPPALDIRGGLQPADAAPMRNPIYTIGHSTRPIEEFVELLRINGVERLADIRTIPKSRRNPQYWQDALKERLEADGIDYVYLPGLGGRRRARKDSVNTAWRNASFKGYADHMQTEEFAAALEQLIRFGGEKVTAIMCAEAVPWRCHRSLVADALVVRGIEVRNIMSATSTTTHALRDWARVDGTTITYPGDGTDVEGDTGE
jgi:uncharacterized protein (DUF488 family)